MKSVGALTLALGVLWMAEPASAQTYDPRYPVCMHVYGALLGERMDCNFTSIPQCQAGALGLPATCLVNPYYAPGPARPRRLER